MSLERYVIQKETLFSESKIWELNQNFYHELGISAWTSGVVPHKITNSSLASTTYAELIFAFIKDLQAQGKTDEVVYILELGAGHGRLCFNMLRHLDKLFAQDLDCTLKYCYILSDIVEENLLFLSEHRKLQDYYDRGVLDVSYFDALTSKELVLRKSNKTISTSDLALPILTVANYFFDSIPNELFYFKNEEVYRCSISLDSAVDPAESSVDEMINDMDLTYHKSLIETPIFDNKIYNEILAQYTTESSDTYILFPKNSIECLNNIAALSKAGLVVLTMDKGFKNIKDLAGRVEPDIVKHGSFSFWVNFHALGQYCTKTGGYSVFDHTTNLSIELGCFMFTDSASSYPGLEQMFRKHTSQINLDDFNSIKKFVYQNITRAKLPEILSMIRLSGYDPLIFIDLMPMIKQLSKSISIKQRTRLKQTIDHVSLGHYEIKEDYDLSYELGGMLYDLGYYTDALTYFDQSEDRFGNKIDVNYNQLLCYFQLRQDQMFYKALKEAKLRFPDTDAFLSLEQLNME